MYISIHPPAQDDGHTMIMCPRCSNGSWWIEACIMAHLRWSPTVMQYVMEGIIGVIVDGLVGCILRSIIQGLMDVIAHAIFG